MDIVVSFVIFQMKVVQKCYAATSSSPHVSVWPICNFSNWQTSLLITIPVLKLIVTLWNRPDHRRCSLPYETNPQFLLKNPVCEHFKDLNKDCTRWTWRTLVLYFKLLACANTLGTPLGKRKHLKWNRVCPTNSASSEVPIKQLSWDTGILSSLFLYTYIKIFGCPGMPLVRSCLESSTFLVPGWSKGDNHCRIARTSMTQNTRWTDSFLTIAKVWTWSCDLQVWNASILIRACWSLPLTSLPGVPSYPWPTYKEKKHSLAKEKNLRTNLTPRKIRTLVCDSLDWVFSQLPPMGFLNYFCTNI